MGSVFRLFLTKFKCWCEFVVPVKFSSAPTTSFLLSVWLINIIRINVTFAQNRKHLSNIGQQHLSNIFHFNHHFKCLINTQENMTVRILWHWPVKAVEWSKTGGVKQNGKKWAKSRKKRKNRGNIGPWKVHPQLPL